jgi:hypothetical protein
MKSTIRHNFLLGLMLVTALVSLVPTSVFAADNTAFLTPASGTSQTGSSFTISVDGHVTLNYAWVWFAYGANSAQGTINFPSQQLRVTSVSMNGSSFADGASPTFDNAAGNLSFNLSSSTAYMNQDVHLFSITFQSVSAGSSAVSFGSTQYNIGTAATTGGTYTINAPPSPVPSPTSKPTTTPKPTSKPVVKSTPTPSPIATPTPEETPAPVSQSDGGLKIENVKVTASRSENSIGWSLNNPAAKPTFAYGTNKDSLKDVGDLTPLADGTYKASLEDTKLGTLYYFTIKAATDDNLQGATYSGVLTTRGYPVALTIQQNGLQIPGAKLKIGTRTFVTNKDAIVTTELSDGNFSAEITAPNETISHTAKFTVKKLSIPTGGNPTLQSIVLNIGTAIDTTQSDSSSPLPLIIGGGIATLLAIGGGIGFVLMKRRKATTAGTDQSVDVDTGQLQQKYGSDVQQYMTNTPEPNLGGHFLNPPELAPLPPLTMSDPQSNATDVAPPPAAAGAVDLATAPPLEAQAVVNQYDPAALPLPAATDATAQDLAVPVQEPAYVEQVSQAPQAQPAQQYMQEPATTVDDNPALAEDITKVESSEQPVEDSEPSAIYDASTGELAIIHHHTQTPVTVTNPAQQGAA